jgi:hypothetical protein
MLKGTVVATVSTLLVNFASMSIEWSWHDKVLWVANLILAVVGFVGIVVAWLTLLKIERQTKTGEVAALAAKAGAEAALLNAQAVINAERAWIVIDVESPAPNQFNFIATNTGRIPADVKSIWATSIVTKNREKLNVPIDEKTGESLINTPPCLIPPNAKQIVLRCNIDEMDKHGTFGRNLTFSRGFAELRFYGRILYSDILQPAESAPYETKWLYWQVPIQGALPFPDPIYPEHNSYC